MINVINVINVIHQLKKSILKKILYINVMQINKIK
jgi:hypothetical protein